jgi:hypothetical protein
MAFLIRAISHSAEGREIVRPSRVEGERLSIGRDPACDVHLTDLAVALRHAVAQREAGRLEIVCEAGLTVELNGRKAAAGVIELATGGELLIASHLLRFMPLAAGSDEISVDVERVTESEVKLDKSAERLFSLSSVMPTKRAGAWLLAILILALGLGWPIYAYMQRQAQRQHSAEFARFQADEIWSTGHLSAGHAALQKNCSACHVKPFESVRDTACLSCHASVHDHGDPFRLARARPELTGWGRFQLRVKQAFNLPPGRCIDCHTEHEGASEMPVTPQKFCSDCHADLKARLPDTRIGNARDFGEAHPEFKPVLVAGWSGGRPVMQRVGLDAHPREASGLKFPHALHLSRSNGVAQMARRLAPSQGFGQALQCKDCHSPTSDGIRFRPVDMEADCEMCHSLAYDRIGGSIRSLPHGRPALVVAALRDQYGGRSSLASPNFSPVVRRRPGEGIALTERVRFAAGAASAGGAERAIRSVFSPGGACYDCHRVVAPPPGSLDFRIEPVSFPSRYLQRGWFDHRAHRGQTCQSCHGAEGSQSASDLLLPGINSCRACHGGERTSKPVASACAMCHDYHLDRGAPTMIVKQRIGGRGQVGAERGRVHRTMPAGAPPPGKRPL